MTTDNSNTRPGPIDAGACTISLDLLTGAGERPAGATLLTLTLKSTGATFYVELSPTAREQLTERLWDIGTAIRTAEEVLGTRQHCDSVLALAQRLLTAVERPRSMRSTPEHPLGPENGAQGVSGQEG